MNSKKVQLRRELTEKHLPPNCHYLEIIEEQPLAVNCKRLAIVTCFEILLGCPKNE